MSANILRTIILYLLVIAGIRFMGKRQIGEMQPSELVITIMLSELVAVPIEDMRLPLLRGIIPIITLITLEVFFSFIALKFRRAQGYLEGHSRIVIRHGQIMFEELKRLRYNIDDLAEDLRIAGYYDIRDVEYAILETKGKLSVLPKSCKNPATTGDLGIQCAPAVLPYVVIRDGRLDTEQLKDLGISENTFFRLLKKKGVDDYRKVLYATVDETEDVYIQKK